jgi:DNA-binding CsgD family transcriptional regulator
MVMGFLRGRQVQTRIPLRFVDSVNDQLRHLSAAARDALATACVLGRRFSADELAALTATTPAAILGALRSLLRARGVRPPVSGPRSAPDWPELTESEFTVVSLVAQGATNREVAERLFLSPYTVNSHLRHVFAKLGIRSRVELTLLAGARGIPAERS